MKILKYGGFYLCISAFVIMAILRLTGLSEMSWWWITCPLWIPLAGLITLLTILMYAAYGATDDENEHEYYN